MRQIGKVLALLLAIGVVGQASYVYYQLFSNTYTTWQQNGSLTAVVDSGWGITTASATGGSIISTAAVPDGSANYEAAMTLNIGSSGGTYTIFLEATSNAVLGTSSATGSFYSVSLTPTFSGGTCTGYLSVSRSVSGVMTTLLAGNTPCRNGMTLHAVALTGAIWIYGDAASNGAVQTINGVSMPTPQLTGKAGFGVSGAPAGNDISNLRVGPFDRVAPGQPTGVNSYATPNRVDLHVNGAGDDANGVGVGAYLVWRDGAYFSSSASPDFTDNTIQAGDTSHTYSIMSQDRHGNASSPVNTTVTIPPAAAIDPRQVGLRATGSYWGGIGEQIDTRSGNLNYSYPLVSLQGRGWKVPLGISYNSQNWAKDTSGSNWEYGSDTGYGYGWNLQLGALRKYSLTDGWTADHWEFRDASGATYRLDQNNSGVWSSQESMYVWYDANAGVLHFRDGTFWIFGCMSYGIEADAGDYYPTVIEDTNGNQITITYAQGDGAGWSNSSARITNVTDVRGSAYSFTYSTVSGAYNPRYLSKITNNFKTSDYYSFQYSAPVALTSPLTSSYTAETTVMLNSITSNATGLVTSFSYDVSNSGELKKVTFPYGGWMRWAYGNTNYSGGHLVREVTNRYLQWDAAIGERGYTFSRDSGDTGRYVPLNRTVADSQANAKKIWTFNQSGAAEGLISSYLEERNSDSLKLRQTNYTWAQDASGNDYISRLQAISDPGQSYAVTKQTDQTVDAYGNVTQMKLYAYGNLSTPAKTYTNTFLTNSNYTSRYIYNRLVSSTVTDGTNTLTLATNTYDGAAPSDTPGITQHDSAYGISFAYRGNLSKTVSFGQTRRVTVADITGTVVTADDGNTNHGATVTNDSTTNYAAPVAITTANALTTSMSWDSLLNQLGTTGPNSDTAGATYDTASRPATATSPFGAVTTYTYSTSAPQISAVVNGRWTQTYLDGLGRTYRVASGTGAAGSTTVSTVDTVYDACGCTPMGKPYKTSTPYAPGNTPVYKVNTYDAIGRTLTTVAPDGASTTSYLYQGNTLKVTDAAGKNKTYQSDAFGQLTEVDEPGPGTEPTHVTTYAYDLLGHLITVTMPRTISGVVKTQTRTWTYDPATQRLSSVQQPENGTTSYTYNTDGTLATKTDAKNQQTQYTYDLYGELAQISRGTLSGSTFTEDLQQRIVYTYSGTNGHGAQAWSQNTARRLSQITCPGRTTYRLPNGTATLLLARWRRSG